MAINLSRADLSIGRRVMQYMLNTHEVAHTE